MTCIFMTYFERRLYHRNRLNCLRHDEGKKCMSSKKSFYKRSSCPTLVRSCSHVAGTVGGGGGEQGWRSGKSTQLPPVSFGFRSRRQSHMWVEFGFDSRSWSDSRELSKRLFPIPNQHFKIWIRNANLMWNARIASSELLGAPECSVG